MRRSVVILMHLFYWLVYFCLLSLFFGMSTMYTPPHQQGPFTDWNVLMLGFAIVPGGITFYGAYSVLFRQLLVPRKIALLILSLAGLSIFSTAAGQLILYRCFPLRINWTVETVVSMGVVMSVNAALNGIVGLGLNSFVTWYDELKSKEALSRKNYEMELAQIRLQLSPHFLFNTINNIDTLIGQDPVKASAYLNKLSGMMRFMLYETRAAIIPLEQELAYIGNYINLQQIRTANPDYVQYRLTGSSGSLQIPPMLFIPFIENAFKHSTPRRTGNAIAIAIDIRENAIAFECTNTYITHGPSDKEYGGLGSELINRRLELLYPGTHQLAVTDDAGIYKVKLMVPLSRTI